MNDQCRVHSPGEYLEEFAGRLRFLGELADHVVHGDLNPTALTAVALERGRTESSQPTEGRSALTASNFFTADPRQQYASAVMRPHLRVFNLNRVFDPLQNTSTSRPETPLTCSAATASGISPRVAQDIHHAALFLREADRRGNHDGQATGAEILREVERLRNLPAEMDHELGTVPNQTIDLRARYLLYVARSYFTDFQDYVAARPFSTGEVRTLQAIFGWYEGENRRVMRELPEPERAHAPQVSHLFGLPMAASARSDLFERLRRQSTDPTQHTVAPWELAACRRLLDNWDIERASPRPGGPLSPMDVRNLNVVVGEAMGLQDQSRNRRNQSYLGMPISGAESAVARITRQVEATASCAEPTLTPACYQNINGLVSRNPTMIPGAEILLEAQQGTMSPEENAHARGWIHAQESHRNANGAITALYMHTHADTWARIIVPMVAGMGVGIMANRRDPSPHLDPRQFQDALRQACGRDFVPRIDFSDPPGSPVRPDPVIQRYVDWQRRRETLAATMISLGSRAQRFFQNNPRLTALMGHAAMMGGLGVVNGHVWDDVIDPIHHRVTHSDRPMGLAPSLVIMSMFDGAVALGMHYLSHRLGSHYGGVERFVRENPDACRLPPTVRFTLPAELPEPEGASEPIRPELEAGPAGEVDEETSARLAAFLREPSTGFEAPAPMTVTPRERVLPSLSGASAVSTAGVTLTAPAVSVVTPSPVLVPFGAR